MNDKRRGRPPKLDAQVDRASLAYAKRVWSGQSPDLLPKERIDRVIRALEAQSLPTDGIDAQTIEAAL